MANLPTKAISKEKLRRQADDDAAIRYRRRLELDQRLADMRLEKSLREVWR